MEKLFNIKMRASKYDIELGTVKHISGAEKIVGDKQINEATKSMIIRAFNHDRGRADKINISIDLIKEEEISYIPCLDIYNIESTCVIESHLSVLKLLECIGIDKKRGTQILQMLESVSNMRGAVLLDISNMKRLELDRERGIRATSFDWRVDLISKLNSRLKQHHMDNIHVIEALALASKVVHNSCVLGEICISDDPDYTTGYMSIRGMGYFRIKNFKLSGSDKGVRIILFDGTLKDAKEYIHFLENTVTVIDSLPNINETKE